MDSSGERAPFFVTLDSHGHGSMICGFLSDRTLILVPFKLTGVLHGSIISEIGLCVLLFKQPGRRKYFVRYFSIPVDAPSTWAPDLSDEIQLSSDVDISSPRKISFSANCGLDKNTVELHIAGPSAEKSFIGFIKKN